MLFVIVFISHTLNNVASPRHCPVSLPRIFLILLNELCTVRLWTKILFLVLLVDVFSHLAG